MPSATSSARLAIPFKRQTNCLHAIPFKRQINCLFHLRQTNCLHAQPLYRITTLLTFLSHARGMAQNGSMLQSQLSTHLHIIYDSILCFCAGKGGACQLTVSTCCKGCQHMHCLRSSFLQEGAWEAKACLHLQPRALHFFSECQRVSDFTAACGQVRWHHAWLTVFIENNYWVNCLCLVNWSSGELFN